MIRRALRTWMGTSNRGQGAPNPAANMRYLILVLFVSMLLCTLLAQARDDSPETDIRDALNPQSDFYGSGIMDKRVSRMGDAAAVAITKVVAGKPLDTATIDRLLAILQTAFSAPQIVENESDRAPRSALFVLNSLNHQTSSPKQKKN